MLANRSSRVFWGAHTAASPEAPNSQSALSPAMRESPVRTPGSEFANLPKKLSSSAVAREVWSSVLPIMPNA